MPSGRPRANDLSRTTVMSFGIPEHIRDHIQAIAGNAGVPLAHVVRDLLVDGLAGRGIDLSDLDPKRATREQQLREREAKLAFYRNQWMHGHRRNLELTSPDQVAQFDADTRAGLIAAPKDYWPNGIVPTDPARLQWDHKTAPPPVRPGDTTPATAK